MLAGPRPIDVSLQRQRVDLNGELSGLSTYSSNITDGMFANV